MYNASMTSTTLSSRSNTKIKHLRALQQRKQRQQAGIFAVEGSGLIREALAAGFELHQLFSLTEAVPAAAPEQYLLSPELMAYVSSMASPPDAIGLFALRQVAEDPERHPAWLLADRLQDPGNFGALLRLADAMGWRGVLALGSHPDPFAPKVIRGSMGSCLRVPVRALELPELPAWQAAGWTLAGTAAAAAVSSLDCRLPRRLLLALGHEGQGLDSELLQACDLRLAIPIRPPVDSLNVATAAAMLMHEYARQHPSMSEQALAAAVFREPS